MDYTAFSHGQVTSKLWLIDNIEKYLFPNIQIVILGGWYNVLGFLLFSRYKQIGKIVNIDINQDAITIADKICDSYKFENKVLNVVGNANQLNNYDYDLVINCSPEHMHVDDWFELIKPNSLVCLQSSDMDITTEPWFCVNPNKSLEYFVTHYRIHEVYFSDEIEFVYSNLQYKRFMLIGRK